MNVDKSFPDLVLKINSDITPKLCVQFFSTKKMSLQPLKIRHMSNYTENISVNNHQVYNVKRRLFSKTVTEVNCQEKLRYICKGKMNTSKEVE